METAIQIFIDSGTVVEKLFPEGTTVVRNCINSAGMRQVVLRFPNNYGASVIRPWENYYPSQLIDHFGVEIGTIRFISNKDDRYTLHGLFGSEQDVIFGHLEKEDVKELLVKISKLPKYEFKEIIEVNQNEI